ncbi:MFS transporter [Marinobacterium nitratireducens]|uniref:MFS transporter n=1 Tax=Marinobacterium nitratireducens TaxID=518897 RepID=A0A918DVC9_9GAMM|nr:L-fucose:H+ symporter permease [Marinobacterium nitratireducens]GGO85795.1 MFS transporter [Marinobacterium nitratireducens]
MNNKTPMVFREMILPFILLTTCFAAWGVAANMTDPLVKVFSKIFTMSALESALVQFAYYGAYFCLALPAAFINRRFSYKTGVLTGLGFAALGALMFYPASQAMTYGYFLAALFILAAGLSILETSANPFVIAMGPVGNATRRLNFAQAFNPVGCNIGVFLGASLILTQLNPATAVERAAMAPAELSAIQSAELDAVMVPYVGMACVLLLIWMAIAMMRIRPSREKVVAHSRDIKLGATLGRLLRNRHYRFGVVAQFFNVGAQTCVWTFTIQYVMDALSVNEARAGDYLQYSLILFLIARFAMTWLMGYIRASKLLAGLSVLATALCGYMIASPDISGVWALVAISGCLSLMFPTIYGIALQGLGEDTKFGAAGLVMAILGGAIMPLVQGAVIDGYGATLSFIVPAACFLVVARYGYFDLKAERKAHSAARPAVV